MKNDGILLILPLPPPWTGQSVESKLFVDYLKNRKNALYIINTAKQNLSNGKLTYQRLFSVLRIFYRTLLYRKQTSTVYISLAQSFLGHLRDLVLLVMCRKKNITCHLHGSGIREHVFVKHPVLFYLTRKIFASIKIKVIVLSRSLRRQFSGVLSEENIFDVFNFPETGARPDRTEIEKKYLCPAQMKILFLSNLLREKGFLKLLSAVKKTNGTGDSPGIVLDIVGMPENRHIEKIVREYTERKNGIQYFGGIGGKGRFDFFLKAHVFCLPTWFKYEGQPVSILEAYANGCAVATTDHGGISDIFEDGVNGYLLEKKSIISIQRMMEKARSDLSNGRMKKIGLYNHSAAAKDHSQDLLLKQLEQLLMIEVK